MENHFIQFQLKKIDINIFYIKKNQKNYQILSFAEDLAEYQYYNMDQVVANTLKVFENELK